jgi:hypothetical protein
MSIWNILFGRAVAKQQFSMNYGIKKIYELPYLTPHINS